jgi:hypothetical protein
MIPSEEESLLESLRKRFNISKSDWFIIQENLSSLAWVVANILLILILFKID